MTKSKNAPKPAVKPRKKTPPSNPGRAAAKPVDEIGGPKGPEPTRYGDWEKDGRCIDF